MLAVIVVSVVVATVVVRMTVPFEAKISSFHNKKNVVTYLQ